MRRHYLLIGFVLIGCGKPASEPISAPPAIEVAVPVPPQIADPPAAVPSPPTEPKKSQAELRSELDAARAQLAEDEKKLEAIRAQQRKRAIMRERWDLLTDTERAAIAGIKLSLESGKGIQLEPRAFLAVYGTENEIFIDETLRAAAEISCGPFVDHLHAHYGATVEQRLNLLKVIDQRQLAIDGDLWTQENLLQGTTNAIVESGVHEAHLAAAIEENDAWSKFVALGALGPVVSTRCRNLSDAEIVLLRYFEFSRPALARVRSLGVDPGGAKAMARIVSEVSLARDSGDPDPLGPSPERSRELAVNKRQAITAAKDEAKELPKLLRKFDSLVTQAKRFARADESNPKAVAASKKLGDEVREARERIHQAVEAIQQGATAQGRSLEDFAAEVLTDKRSRDFVLDPTLPGDR